MPTKQSKQHVGGGTVEIKTDSITTKDIIKVAFFTLLLFGITWLTVSGMLNDKDKFNTLLDKMKSANPIWAVMLFLVTPMVWLFADSFVLWKLIRKGGVPLYKFRQSLSAQGVYVIFSLLTPFQSGGQAFLIIYLRKQGVKYSTAIAATFIGAVLFQLITVPISSFLFIYVNNAGVDMYEGFAWLGGSGLFGLSYKSVAWAGTIIALAVNLIAMVIPILISTSEKALNALSRLTAYVKSQKFNKDFKNGNGGKVLLVIAGGLIGGFLTLHFMKQGWAVKGSVGGAGVLFTILLFKFGLYTSESKRKDVYESVREKMLDYKTTFRTTLFSKDILIPCLIVMFIKEANHSLSMVWAAYLDGFHDFNWFLMASVKNVLTLAQTVVPTPGGSGGAEMFYQAGAWSIIADSVGQAPQLEAGIVVDAIGKDTQATSIFIALTTRVSTYWFIIIYGIIFKFAWGPSRKGFGEAAVSSQEAITSSKIKASAKLKKSSK